MKRIALFILVSCLSTLLSGCATRQEAKMDQYGIVRRKETKLFLGFIPILERDISSKEVPIR